MERENGNSRKYTCFSEKRTFSRIDMTWNLKKNLDTKFSKAEILPKTFSDHNIVSLVYEKKSNSFRWRLTRMLQK